MLMRVAVVPQRDPNHPARRLIHREHLGITLLLLPRVGGGKHGHRRTRGISLKPIEFIGDPELRWHAFKQWMIRPGHHHFELLETIVAPRPTPDQVPIVFRPVPPIVPEARVKPDQALT